MKWASGLPLNVNFGIKGPPERPSTRWGLGPPGGPPAHLLLKVGSRWGPQPRAYEAACRP